MSVARKPFGQMNWLDRAIAAVAPRTALGRAKARLQLDMVARGGFEAARADWRGSSWRAEPPGANTALYGDIVSMRQRARSMVRNSPLAKRSIEILTAHTVGCGIRPSWQTESKAQRRRLKSAWDRFVETADARRQVDLYGLQAQAVQAMFETGEVLTLRDEAKRGGVSALSYLLIEGDQLDHNREGVFDRRVTRLGVALDENWHSVAGYWLFDQNPGDAILWGYYPVSRFVPREGVNHLYRIRRPGQFRGVPELAASLPIMRDLADYQEAALVKARIEACFSAFITSEDAATGTLATRTDQKTGADGTTHNTVIGELSPGVLQRLSPGEKIDFAQPTSSSDFSAFMLNGTMAAAAGAGVTYDQATGDLRQANYSSLRAGKIEFRRSVEMIQHLTVVPMLCRPWYRDFLAYGRTHGDLIAADERVGVRWVTPAWEPIDPVKDLNADILAVRSGRMSLGDYIASWGEDPHEQIEEIAAFNKLLDASGIVLDTDPRKMNAGGQMQPPQAPDSADAAKPANKD